MVPFTEPLLLACRKLAAKLMASMRFEGRVFLSEIGWPEHEYSDLIQLFGNHHAEMTAVLTSLCTLFECSQSHAHLQACLYKRGVSEYACLTSMTMKILLIAQLAPNS